MPTSKIQIPEKFEALFKPARYKAYYSGRGAGKSHSFAAAAVISAWQEPLRWLCCREFQYSIKDSVKRLLDDKIAALNLQGFFRSTDSDIRGANGSMFIFAGLHNNVSAIKSMEGINRCWVEEAQTASKESLVILKPTIFRNKGAEMWFSWNPEDETDPVDHEFRCGCPDHSEKPDDWAPLLPDDAVIEQVFPEDNPFFSGEMKMEMALDLRRDPDLYEHVWRGGYKKSSSATIFKNWRVGKPDEPIFKTDHKTRFFFGADWGFSKDPSVYVRVYFVGRTLVIDYEAWEIGCDIDYLPFLFGGFDDVRIRNANKQAYEKLKGIGRMNWAGVPGAYMWPSTADSARPETISYMQQHGFPRMRKAVKGKDSIDEGEEFLKTYDIVVHPRCAHTIRELTYYRWKVDPKTGDILPIRMDKNNHVIDALRYAVEGIRRAPKTVRVGRLL